MTVNGLFRLFMPAKFPEQKAQIEAIIKRIGLPSEEIANRAAIKPETLRKIAGGYQLASKRILSSLLNVEATVKANPQPVVSVDDGVIIEQRPIRLVPVISWAAAGNAQDYSDMAEQIDQKVETTCRDENAFALIIEGDSMEPRYMAGDIVIFAPGSEPRNGTVVVARLIDGHGVLFKKFKRTGEEGKTIILESLNPHYKAKTYPESAFRFIYPAVELRARLNR